MDRYAKIIAVNHFCKSPILDVWQGSENAFENGQKFKFLKLTKF